jgi:hypothetical protein
MYAHDTLGRNVQGVVAADGSYEIKGVPPGTWTVSAWCQKDQEQWHAQAVGSAGATLDLVLERRSR